MWRRYDDVTVDERFVVISRYHPVILLWPTLSAGFVVWAGYQISVTELFIFISNSVIVGVQVIALSVLVWSILSWWTTELLLTDKRLIHSPGPLPGRSYMVPLSALTQVRYARPPVGRFLGWGTLFLDTSGDDLPRYRVDFAPEIVAFYQTIAYLVLEK